MSLLSAAVSCEGSSESLGFPSYGLNNRPLSSGQNSQKSRTTQYDDRASLTENERSESLNELPRGEHGVMARSDSPELRRLRTSRLASDSPRPAPDLNSIMACVSHPTLAADSSERSLDDGMSERSLRSANQDPVDFILSDDLAKLSLALLILLSPTNSMTNGLMSTIVSSRPESLRIEIARRKIFRRSL